MDKAVTSSVTTPASTTLIVGADPLCAVLESRCTAVGQPVLALTSAEWLRTKPQVPSCSLIIEAETGAFADKCRLLASLPDELPVLSCAHNASVLEAAGAMTNPGRAMGYACVLPLPESGGTIEIARSPLTIDASAQAAHAFWQSLGMTAVEVADSPGLVRMRVLACLINEALSALGESIATAEDIDRAMRLGTAYPRGPIEWGRLLGYPAVLGTMQALEREFGEDRYRPAPALRRMALVEEIRASDVRNAWRTRHG